jgi:hypothetical protein
MTGRRVLCVLILAMVVAAAQYARGDRRWAVYEDEMQNPIDDPPDAWEAAEFAFARLRFRSPRDGFYYARWGIDANKSERQFVQGVRRLTRVHTRSVEQVVDIDSDEIFDWPWLYAVAAGDWELTDAQVLRLRRYFERGGFLMVDDFHGEREWSRFAAGIARIFPGRPIIELRDDDPIFHVLYDLRERLQVPGQNVVHGSGYERGGVVPHWRGVVDDKGRVQVAICFNMDLGDAWEYADDPEYPERFASHAYRLGINYVLYAMTH